MKRTHKYLISIALSSVLGLFIAVSANAQHRGGGGGGGGGFHGGGGGGGSTMSTGGGSRPSVSTSGNFRPSVSNSGSRPSISGSRVGIASPRGVRPSVGVAGRTGGYNYAVRPYVNAGSRSYIGGRGYIGAGGRASVGAGGRGLLGGGYRGGGYYHYHGYYNTYYAPRLGFSIGFLPYGYYPFYWGDYQYFYSGGLYYQYDNSQYTVVEPPVGAEITSLPSNAQSIVINGQQYYELNGVYYEPITKDDGTTSYQIAGKDGELNTNVAGGDDTQQLPQVGDIVESLPQDCRKISLNGQKYYVSSDGYYYQETVDANHNKAYKIVGTPDDDPATQQQN